jgi:endoglucanase
MHRALATALLPLLFLAATACDSGSHSTKPTNGVPVTDDMWLRTGPPPVEVHGALSVVGTDILDQSGAIVQLKGVSSMWLNYETTGYAEDPDALLWMRDHWGLEIIRAAMGIEPRGAYLADPNKAKQQVTTVIDGAIAAGIYVIIDWHDSHALLHQDQALAFFSEMAAKYAGVPNVLYETFNEPLAVDWVTQLKPYHEAVVGAIRASEPNGLIILGTPSWSQSVDIAAQSPLEGTNLLYTLHFYACTHGASFLSRAQTAYAAGLPLFVSEWGATSADGGLDGIVCADAAAMWIRWLNSVKVGWTSWKLDDCTPDSSCLLKPNAPLAGGWDTSYLHGHGQFVRDAMRQ